MKKQRHYFTNKCPSSQSYGFSGSHVQMWELDHKESWVPKNWCFWTVVLVKTLESPLDFKENKSVNPKGNHSWIFTGRTDAEAKVPILQPLDAKRWFIRKDLDAGKDWRQEEKGMTEDVMVGWNHWLSEHEFEQAPEDGDEQGSLVCCSPWGCKELDMTERLHFHFSFLGRKLMTNLDSILKSRNITLPTEVHVVKAMVFPVVMYGCEIWTIKKAEHQRTDAFKLWSWRRLLRIPWTARRSNQSILREINPEYSLEALMLKLKLQSFCHLKGRTDSLEKTLMLGKMEGGKRRAR